MARLIDMSAEDFCQFESFTLGLADQGLVFVGGENRDTDAADSNGAGKSNVFKALSWVIFGRAVDNEEGDKVIRKGAKCARVILNMEDGDDRYRITRERRKQSPKLFIDKNDEPIDKSKDDLQLVINRLVGMDWEGFRNTVLYGQNDTKRFVYPTTKDSVRKDILHRILRTGIFKLCHEEALKRNRELKAKEESIKTEIDSLKDRIDEVDVEELQKRFDSFGEDKRTKIKKLASEARALVKQAREAREGPAPDAIESEIAKIDEELGTLKGKIADAKAAKDRAEDQRSEAATKIARLEANVADLDERLKLLKGEKCPTCTAPLSKGHGATHRRDVQAQRDDLGDRLGKAREGRQKALQAREAAKTALTTHEAERDRLTDLRTAKAADLAEAKAAVVRTADLTRQAREKASQARAAKTEANPHGQALSEAKEKVSKLKQRRKAARDERKDVSLKRAAVEFWTRGFGPSGLPSFILDSTMPYLTERANRYLETLSDGDITIRFSTQRELKSAAGEFRDEIAITWTIEGVDEYPPSGGQFKKMEIATDLAMMDLVATRETAHANLLCLDECLDGVDVQGAQRVIKLLHELRSSRESIFVISHDPALAEVFEKSLLVVKEDGVSTLQEVA